MTIKDVAKKAGVSIATISRVINNKPEGISPEKRIYIQKIIEEMGYKPSGLARGLVTKRTSTIGLLIPDISNPFFPLMARGVEDGAQANKYSVFLCNTDGEIERERQYMSILKERGVDGIILTISQGTNKEYVREIIDGSIPVVLLDEPVAYRNVYGVFVDNHKGGYLATRHLIELGHKKIACITGPYSSITSIKRMEGYKHAITEAGISIDESIIMSGDYKEETGFKYMDEIIRSSSGVTAVFSASDNIAIGIYRAAKSHGLKIPKDLSVVGFDDAYSTQLIEPALTDVQQPTYEMGIKAVETILKLLSGSNVRKKIITFEPKLIVRESTRIFSVSN